MASTATPMTARDAGLVRGVTFWPLAAAFVGMLVGSGIFTVPSAMAAAVGPWAPLAYLACAIAVGAMLLCFAEGVSRVPTSGSVAGFVAAYGPYWGYLTGVLNWAAAVVASGGIAAAAADIIGCAAALRLRRRGTALAGLPVRIPALQMFAVLGSAAMLWVAAQSTRAEALGIAGLIVAVSVVYRLRRQPALASA